MAYPFVTQCQAPVSEPSPRGCVIVTLVLRSATVKCRWSQAPVAGRPERFPWLRESFPESVGWGMRNR
jgi:hypothetical protein